MSASAEKSAALYRHWRGGVATAEQLHGKEMSYNNYVDTDAAWRAASDFGTPAVAIIKHANPCGIALGSDIAEAHALAQACDPVSAFGGVIAANRPVSVDMAKQVAEVFTEVIVATDYEPGAAEILQGKKNIRILRFPAVWALVMNHFCSNWGFYVILAWLPRYFADVHGLDLKGAASSRPAGICSPPCRQECLCVGEEL